MSLRINGVTSFPLVWRFAAFTDSTTMDWISSFGISYSAGMGLVKRWPEVRPRE